MRQLILDEICNLISGLRMTPSRTFRPTGFVQIRLQSLSHGYSEFQEHFSLCNHNSTHTKHTILESCVLISMYINVQDYWGRVESKQQFWGWQDWPVHLSCEPWTALPPWHSRHYQDDPPLLYHGRDLELFWVQGLGRDFYDVMTIDDAG